MAIREKKLGSILLIRGIDISLPAEFIDDSSARNSENFEISRGVLTKRSGNEKLGGIIGKGTLTLTGNAGDTQTVVIGAKTYTFQTVLTNVDGNVLIGASASDSIDNLIAAINLGSGSGTLYAAATTAHPLNVLPNSIIASAGAGDTMDIVINQDDNTSVATTETLASGSWGASTATFATNLEIMGGREFTREDVAYNVRVGRDKIERYNPSTRSWVDITATDLTGETTDLVSTAIPLLSGQPILCITNGKDPIQKWTASGTVAVLGGTPPVARFIQEYKTYLVGANIAGGVDVNQRVQWCDTANPENWSTGNAGSVDLIEDGEGITGLNLFGSYVCVHKERSIYLGYLVSSTAVFLFDRKATGVGTIANGSIQNLPSGEQIFLAKDGLYLFNGANCRTLSEAINEEIRDSINAEYAKKAWSVLVRSKKEVWIGVPLGADSYGETVYKYNYENKTILKDIRPYVNSCWIGVSTAGLTWDEMTGTWDDQTARWDGAGLAKGSDVVNISDINGHTYAISQVTKDDNGDAVSAVWVTKDYQDSQQRISRFNKLELWAKGSSVKVEYSTDHGDTWTEMIDSPFTLMDEYPDISSPDIFYFDVVSSTIRFRFSNDGSEESLSIKQFIISYIPREMRN